MSTQPQAALASLCAEIERLLPSFLEDPVDLAQSGGNAAYLLIGPDGTMAGRILGPDRARGLCFFTYAFRKVSQVARTGYPTGRFEELVYAGQLDETQFGLNRPDFFGWEGGVALLLEDGSLVAAGFSGFRGVKDVEILEKAAAAVSGVRVRRC
jgi:glc operon protein GlcG